MTIAAKILTVDANFVKIDLVIAVKLVGLLLPLSIKFRHKTVIGGVIRLERIFFVKL